MEFPKVHDYSDFRLFLADWHKARQAEEPSFSRTEFVRQLGLPRTRSFFVDILKGKALTPTFLERVVKVMGLPKEEAQFFRTLVRFNQAQTTPDRELYYEQLIAMNRSPRRILEAEQFDYYKDWRNPAIRNLLEVVDWDGKDAASLGRKLVPNLTPGEAKKAFALLRRMGLVALTDSGFWKPTDKVLSSGDGSRDESVRQYQLQCLELAAQGILAPSPPGERDLSTSFIALSEEAYELLRRRVRNFRSEIRSIVHKDDRPASRLVHFELLLLPLTKPESHA